MCFACVQNLPLEWLQFMAEGHSAESQMMNHTCCHPQPHSRSGQSGAIGWNLSVLQEAPGSCNVRSLSWLSTPTHHCFLEQAQGELQDSSQACGKPVGPVQHTTGHTTIDLFNLQHTFEIYNATDDLLCTHGAMLLKMHCLGSHARSCLMQYKNVTGRA